MALLAGGLAITGDGVDRPVDKSKRKKAVIMERRDETIFVMTADQPVKTWLCGALVVLIASLGVFANPAKADHGPKTWANAVASVVVVNPTWPGYNRPGFGAPAGTAPAGTGVYFAVDGAQKTPFVITAAHVVERAKAIEIVDMSGAASAAYLAAVDVDRDIAILRVDRTGPAIDVAMDEPAVGSHVCALGNSFGLGISFSCGVVSAVGRTNIKINRIEDFIQTDAAINPGSSGGALVDSAGRLVGMIGAIFTKDADIDAGVNFAVSARLIEAALNRFKATGHSFYER